MFGREHISYRGYGDYSQSHQQWKGKTRTLFRDCRYAHVPANTILAKNQVAVIKWYRPGDRIKNVKTGKFGPVSGVGEGMFLYIFF